MSYVSTTINGVFAIGGIALAALVDFVIPEPEPPFMVINSIEQSGAQVVSDRTVDLLGPADWTVTLVVDGQTGPICSGNGWSDYQQQTYIREMHYDIWANDVGCWDRLDEGQEVTEYVSWVPRTQGGPVTYRRSFVVQKGAEQ